MPCVAEADTFRYRGYGIKRLTEGLGYAERVMEMCSGRGLWHGRGRHCLLGV